MKKVLLIVAIVLCIAVAGTALAVTAYENAKDVNGTVTADKYLVLSLDGSSPTASIQLDKVNKPIYKIHYDVSKSASVDEDDYTCTLTVKLTAPNGKNLNGVTAKLYSDDKCINAVQINDEDVKIEGTGDFSIEGIKQSGDYYIQISFAGADSQDALANIAGNMNIDFTQQIIGD